MNEWLNHVLEMSGELVEPDRLAMIAQTFVEEGVAETSWILRSVRIPMESVGPTQPTRTRMRK